jgi:hypothetical protein
MKEIDPMQAKSKGLQTKKNNTIRSCLIPSGVKSPQVTLASCPANELR